jgi:hypothetical protein
MDDVLLKSGGDRFEGEVFSIRSMQIRRGANSI